MIMKDAGNGRFRAAHLSELRIPGAARIACERHAGRVKGHVKISIYEITVYSQYVIVAVRLPAIPPLSGE